VEESTIAHITPKENMSDIFAWYSLIGTAGTALGMMVCGWLMSILQETQNWEFVAACRVVFLLYAAVGVIKFGLTMGLSENVEADSKNKKKKQQQQQQQQNGNNGSRETEPLLGSTNGQNQEQGQEQDEVETPSRRRIPFLPGVEPQFVGLVSSLFLLFAMDAFGSSLASL
jgi:MFS family permease